MADSKEFTPVPSAEQLEFIGRASKAISEKYDIHPTELALSIRFTEDGLLANEISIVYAGLRDFRVNPGDTVQIDNSFHSTTPGDNDKAGELRVPVPKSF